MAAREPFDIVMMDIRLPDMSGTDAVAFIRRLEAEGKLPRSPLTARRGRLPIIALTAFAMQGDRECFIAAGMDAYISKPVRKETLFEIFERWTSPDAHG